MRAKEQCELIKCFDKTGFYTGKYRYFIRETCCKYREYIYENIGERQI